MAFRTTTAFIDRKEQHEQIAKLLDRVQNGETYFAALEFYGIGGLGKSRILDDAKDQCRQRNLPFAVIDFLVTGEWGAESLEIDMLLRICDQLDHYFSLSPVRALLTTITRNGRAEERAGGRATPTEQDVFVKFRLQFAEAVGHQPLVLMLDSIEHCPDRFFDWLGQELIAPLGTAGLLRGLALFLAGRGPRVNASHWPAAFIRATSSFRLDPLDFAATAEHLGALPPQGRYRQAAKEIYALSNGHPYSTEAIVERLDYLGVKVEAVGAQRPDLARRLYDAVIHRYVLSDADDWVLPLLEIASIFRRFDAGILSQLVSRYRPHLAPNQPIQWYVARLTDLQARPLHLVYVGKGEPAYELEPTLRKLLHTALAILNPDETIGIHQHSKELYERMLSGTAIPDVMAEILYHTAQTAAIQGQDSLQPVRTELERLLGQHFRPQRPRDLQNLNVLKDLLRQDADLNELVGWAGLNQLAGQIEEFLTPPPAPPVPFQFSHLVIEHFPPTEYRVSWYRASNIVMPTESIHSHRKFTLDEWRSRTQAIGQVAFHLYLPDRAQHFMQTHRDWAIQLSTNWTDIPWELLHDETDFLCLSRPMARKPKLLKEPREHLERQDGQRRALVVGNPTGDLPGAEAEARVVCEMLEKAGMAVTLMLSPRQATANEFAIRVRTERYDLIHFAGHGHFKPETPRLSGLLFPDGPVLGEELERNLSSRAFVFLSACEAAKTQTEKSTAGFRGEFIEGVAISALLGGAIGCLGPMWEIEDGLAKDFAVAFYEHLLTGQPIGEAVRQARLSVRDRSPDFWASWVLYGDPLQFLMAHQNP